MHPQHRIPPGRTEGSVRRPRPAPLSPTPEWRAQLLFVEPHYSGVFLGTDDVEEQTPYPEPQAPRPRRSTNRP